MRALCDEYFHGLCWVLRYHNATVPSGRRVYRHHYAALASAIATFVQYVRRAAFTHGAASPSC